MDKNVLHTQWNTIQPLKKEILSYTTTWMKLEDILSEISYSQKSKYCMIPLITYLKLSNSEAENKMIVARGWGEEKCRFAVQLI